MSTFFHPNYKYSLILTYNSIVTQYETKPYNVNTILPNGRTTAAYDNRWRTLVSAVMNFRVP